jgi:hypothetical protein
MCIHVRTYCVYVYVCIPNVCVCARAQGQCVGVHVRTMCTHAHTYVHVYLKRGMVRERGGWYTYHPPLLRYTCTLPLSFEIHMYIDTKGVYMCAHCTYMYTYTLPLRTHAHTHTQYICIHIMHL